MQLSPAVATLPVAGQLAAFPGAEGFGALTPGGRGGSVIEVTTLDDDGPGSLRSALAADGARTVVFRVAGTIELRSTIAVVHPYVTLAGQTAPGGGITLRGVDPAVDALLLIETHDVIVRYITLRGGPPSAGDGIEIFAPAGHDTYNVVVDHTSISWAVNRNLATWYAVHDVSIQWNLISEALNCSIHPKGCHSKGVLLGGYASDENKDQPGAHGISLHHNLMAHNAERNPYIEAAGVIDVVNNVVYDPSGTFSHIDMVFQLAPDLVNYVCNYYRPGPSTESKFGIRLINAGAPGAGVYVHGNIGPGRGGEGDPDINIVDPNSRQYVVSGPYEAPPITSSGARDAYNNVLPAAGNFEGLACDGTFVPRRDAIDARVVNDVETGTGKIIDDPSQVGGWLAIPAAAPCPDADHDGMPDAWELKYQFNPRDPSDGARDANGDGYTNLEEYLDGTRPTP